MKDNQGKPKKDNWKLSLYKVVHLLLSKAFKIKVNKVYWNNLVPYQTIIFAGNAEGVADIVQPSTPSSLTPNQ